MNNPREEIAIFGGGCFWCTEATFRMLRGVLSVTPGYAGGTSQNPTYAEVSSGRTSHAEVIQIIFDPSLISFQDLLTVFFAIHDPTTLNQQGADIGTQYRSLILYTTPSQKELAEKYITNLNEKHIWKEKIVTEVEPFKVFYEAEEYHKAYYEKNNTAFYCSIVIDPKITKLKKSFVHLLKDA